MDSFPGLLRLEGLLEIEVLVFIREVAEEGFLAAFFSLNFERLALGL
jgi:hypothetical protein